MSFLLGYILCFKLRKFYFGFTLFKVEYVTNKFEFLFESVV
jgi:hypothetical protein